MRMVFTFTNLIGACGVEFSGRVSLVLELLVWKTRLNVPKCHPSCWLLLLLSLYYYFTCIRWSRIQHSSCSCTWESVLWSVVDIGCAVKCEERYQVLGHLPSLWQEGQSLSSITNRNFSTVNQNPNPTPSIQLPHQPQCPLHLLLNLWPRRGDWSRLKTLRLKS